MAELRPFTPPAKKYLAGPAPRDVRFRHPAYPDSAPDLLVLTAADGDGGLSFDRASEACCIVAGVNWDGGYLALKASENNDLQRVDRPQDGLLRLREYFFCVHGLFKYPVVPSFQHWRFPHGFEEGGTPRGNLPLPWRDLHFPDFTPRRPTVKGADAAMDRDVTCRVTGHMDGVDKAHLVPEGEMLWFMSNKMNRYCRRSQVVSPINDDGNIIVLRKDVHYLFDTRRITFTPQRTSTSESAELVTHVLLHSGSPELISLYHNRPTQRICGISAEYLFARFAWSIFTDEHMPFFQSDLECDVLLWSSSKGEAETRTLKGLDVRSVARVFESTRSQSRSVSPKKRSRSTHGGVQADGGGDNFWSDFEDPTNGDDLDRDELPRGRRRKRDWEDNVPSLSNSFTSESSDVSVPTRRASRPPTPKQAEVVASPSRRPPKRIHVEPSHV